MFGKILSKIIVWVLKSEKIKGEDKSLVTTALLKNIDVLPIRNVITFDQEGTVNIRGKKLELEDAQILKGGARALKDNYTRKVIQEQLLYEANKIGLHQGLNSDQIMFAKAMVYCIQLEENLIQQLDEN